MRIGKGRDNTSHTPWQDHIAKRYRAELCLVSSQSLVEALNWVLSKREFQYQSRQGHPGGRHSFSTVIPQRGSEADDGIKPTKSAVAQLCFASLAFVIPIT